MTTRVITLQQLALESIKEMIVQGKLKPGQRILVDELAAELGMSRLPIREAMRHLQAEGLVNVVDHRGAYVSRLTPQDVQNVYMIRELLEGVGAREGTRKITAEGIEQMRALHTQMDQGGGSTEEPQWVRINEKFHLTLYEASGNDRLVRLILGLMAETSAYVKLAVLFLGGMSRAHSYHRSILEAVEQRDGDRAESLTREHLTQTERTVVEYLVRAGAP